MSRRPFVRKGRRAPFSQLGDWVLCAGIDPPAIAIYWALEAMTWRAQGEDGESHVTHEAEPGRETLAELMGFSRPQSVDRYIDQLVAINAVEVEARPGYPNSYVVHQAPPDDYTGPQSMGQWHNRRAERKTAERDAKTASHPQAPDQQELGSSQVSGGCAPQRTSPKRRYAPQRTGGVRHSAQGVCATAHTKEEVSKTPGKTPPNPHGETPARDSRPLGVDQPPQPPAEAGGASARCEHGRVSCRACGTNPRAAASTAEAAQHQQAVACTWCRQDLASASAPWLIVDPDRPNEFLWPARRCDHVTSPSQVLQQAI